MTIDRRDQGQGHDQRQENLRENPPEQAAEQAAEQAFRYAVNVMPKPGILDPQGRAVEQSLPHLGVVGVVAVRVGRRVELSVAAAEEAEARATVDRLASELLSNPLIEAHAIELLGAVAPLEAVR
jgi:phosphoribosylformylglycinamidine synthase subunit PurS